MSVDALSWAFRLGLPPHEKIVLLSYADRSDEFGNCHPSISDTMRRTGMSERGVQEMNRRLSEGRLIDITKRTAKDGRSTSNRYHLRVSETWNTAPAPNADHPAPDSGGEGAPHNGVVGAPGASSYLNRQERTVRKEPVPPTPLLLDLGSDRDGEIEGVRKSKEEAPQEGSKAGKLSEPEIKERFDTWYSNYPKKEAKGDAEKAYRAAIKIATPEEIMAGLKRVIFPPERQYIPLPATWLRAQRWQDELAPVEQSPSPKPGQNHYIPDEPRIGERFASDPRYIRTVPMLDNFGDPIVPGEERPLPISEVPGSWA